MGLAQEASALPPAFHSHQYLLAQPGGTLLPRSLNLLTAECRGMTTRQGCRRRSASTPTNTTNVLPSAPPSTPDRIPRVGNRAVAQSTNRRQKSLASVCHGNF